MTLESWILKEMLLFKGLAQEVEPPPSPSLSTAVKSVLEIEKILIFPKRKKKEKIREGRL